MKRAMRNILAPIMAAALLFSFGITASAASGREIGDASAARLQSSLEKIEKRTASLEEKLANGLSRLDTASGIRLVFLEGRIKLLENRLANLSLKAANVQLRISIQETAAALKQSKSPLPGDTAAALKSSRGQIERLVDSIAATKGRIRDILSRNKEVMKSKDPGAIEDVFRQIYDVQAERKQALTEINGILQNVRELLTAVSPQTTGA